MERSVDIDLPRAILPHCLTHRANHTLVLISLLRAKSLCLLNVRANLPVTIIPLEAVKYYFLYANLFTGYTSKNLIYDGYIFF